MKAILEFNLPEKKEDLEASLDGPSYKNKIDTLYDEVFRKHFKYEHPIIGETYTDEHDEVLKAIWAKVEEHFND
jgi:hypothetical protein